MSTLTSTILTSKSAVLVYALPLLLVSIPLNLAGAYLSLDKSRFFPSLDDPGNSVLLDVPGTFWEQNERAERYFDEEKHKMKSNVPKTNPQFTRMMRSSKPKSSIWKFGGGVGGLLAGCSFGVYAPTVITLMITEHTGRSMSQVPFLIITFLVAGIFSVLCGLFYQASLLISCVGGSFAITTFAAFAINMSTVGHLVIWAVFAVLLSITPTIYMFGVSGRVLTALHWSMRISQSALGSLGTVYSIAVLAHTPGWEDGLDALWSTNKPDDGVNLALSITGWMLFVLGIACDWILYRTFGPSQDQIWDGYLSHFLDNLPNRAGRFERLPSLWTRIASIFHKSTPTLANSMSSIDEECLPTTLGEIPKNRKERSPRRPVPTVRFDLAAGSSDSETEIERAPLPTKKTKEISKSNPLDVTSESDATLLGSIRCEEINDTRKSDDWTIERYEVETDISSILLQSEDHLIKWKPAFLSKYSVRSSA